MLIPKSKPAFADMCHILMAKCEKVSIACTPFMNVPACGTDVLPKDGDLWAQLSCVCHPSPLLYALAALLSRRKRCWRTTSGQERTTRPSCQIAASSRTKWCWMLVQAAGSCPFLLPRQGLGRCLLWRPPPWRMTQESSLPITRWALLLSTTSQATGSGSGMHLAEHAP